MYGKFQQHLQAELEAIEQAGLYKKERNIASPQSAQITLQDGSEALNFCANNYLGLADNARLIAAAKKAMDERGYGMSSVRFICGTQDLHKQLEKEIANTSIQKMQSSMQLVLTPMVAYLSRFSQLRTQSSPTPSTTHPSSTACASAKRRDTATPTQIWQSLRNASRRPRHSVSASS